MNLYQLNKLIDAVENDAELYAFYCKKRIELIEKIKAEAEKRTGYKRINKTNLNKLLAKVAQVNLADKMFAHINN